MWVLAACDPDPRPADSDPVADTATLETGLAALHVVGSFTTESGTLLSARLGLGFYSAAEDWICIVAGEASAEGPPEAECPGCAWAFDLSGVGESATEGTSCGRIDYVLPEEGVEGYFNYSWGFAETYSYDYAGAPYALQDVVLVHHTGWTPLAYNVPRYGLEQVHGDAQALDFERPLSGYSYAWW